MGRDVTREQQNMLKDTFGVHDETAEEIADDLMAALDLDGSKGIELEEFTSMFVLRKAMRISAIASKFKEERKRQEGFAAGLATGLVLAVPLAAAAYYFGGKN